MILINMLGSINDHLGSILGLIGQFHIYAFNLNQERLGIEGDRMWENPFKYKLVK